MRQISVDALASSTGFRACAPKAPKATPVAPKKAAMRMKLDTNQPLAISVQRRKQPFLDSRIAPCGDYLAVFGDNGGGAGGEPPGVVPFCGFGPGGGWVSVPPPGRV